MGYVIIGALIFIYSLLSDLRSIIVELRSISEKMDDNREAVIEMLGSIEEEIESKRAW